MSTSWDTFNPAQDFIGGLLAGQKVKTFQADLALSEVRRQALENELAYSKQMQPLQLAHQKALNDQSVIQTENLHLAQDLAKRTFDSHVAEASANATTATNEAETSTATKGSRIASAQAITREAQAKALAAGLGVVSAVGGQAGALGVTFTPTDIEAYLKSNHLAGDSPADLKIMGAQFAGALTEGQQRLKENNALIDQHTQQAKLDAAHSHLLGLGLATQIAALGPNGVGVAAAYEGDYPGITDRVKQMVGNVPLAVEKGAGGTVETNPGMAEYQKKIGDNLGVLVGKLQALQSDKKSLEAGRALGGSEASWLSLDSTDRKRLITEKQAEIDDLKSQITDAKAELQPVERKTSKGKADSNGDVPVVKTQDAYNKLAPGATYRESEGGPLFQKPGA